MIISVRYDGGEEALEGDRELWLQQLPADALVLSATATVTPVADFVRDRCYAEKLRFDEEPDGDQAWGATQTQDKLNGSFWVVVDFNARRTLAEVEGSNLKNASLQVDMGAGFVDVNDRGAFHSPGAGKLLKLWHDTESSLPGFTVRRFKLTRDGVTDAEAPEVTTVTVRSAPSNVQLRLGGLGPFWFHPGELNRPAKTPDFAALLQSVLADAVVAGGFAAVPLIVHSDSLCRLEIEVEIEYLRRVSVLPELLGEVLLPFDASGQAQADAGVLEISLPAGAEVQGGGGRLRGSFEQSRILAGPVGRDLPPDTVEVSPAVTWAQAVVVPAAAAVSAVDLPLAAVTRIARLRLELRSDLDGQPGDEALPEAAVEVRLERASTKASTWMSVRLPAELRNQQERAYWLVLQSLEGEATWSVEAAAGAGKGLRHTEDGGLSWRPTADPGGDGATAAIFRLLRRPARFRMPIELQVGAGAAARGVSLARFEPQGRIDFELELPEVVEGFNRYLKAAGPVACPEHEHLEDGGFESWQQVGEELGESQSLPVGSPGSPGFPMLVASSPDGRRAYLLSVPEAETGVQGRVTLFQSIDLASGEEELELRLEQPAPPRPLANLLTPPEPSAGETPRSLPTRTLDYAVDSLRVTRVLLLLSSAIRLWRWLVEIGWFCRFRQRVGKMWARIRDLLRREPSDGNGGPGPNDGAPLFDLAVHPSGHRVYVVASSVLWLIDLNEGRALEVSWKGDPLTLQGLALNPRGDFLYAVVDAGEGAEGQIQRFDTAKLEKDDFVPETGAWPTKGKKNRPKRLAVSPDGRALYVLAYHPSSGDQLFGLDAVSLANMKGLTQGAGMGPGAIAMAMAPDAATLGVVGGKSPDSWARLVDTRLRQTASFPLASEPTAVAFDPHGQRVFVVGLGGLSEVDLETLEVSEPLAADSESGFSDVTLTPAGDRILLTEPEPCLLHLIPVGGRRLTDWQISGSVRLASRLVPLEQDVILGAPPGAVSSGGAAAEAALPAALWQTVSVTAGCRYDFSFRALASEDAVAEIAWSGVAGEWRRTDTLPIEVRNFDDPEEFVKSAVPVLHRRRITAPPDAEQAEVRFTVLAGVAIVDAVSLRGAGEELANGGLRLKESSLIAWSQLPSPAAGFTLTACEGGKDGIEACNAGADPVFLFQIVSAVAERPFDLTLQGHGRSELPGRLELLWLGEDDEPVAPATSLELRRHGFGRAVSGRVPPQAENVKVVLVIPGGAKIHLQRVSLRFPEPVKVPVSFVAQAPGELKVSEWWLSYDQVG